MNTLLLLAIILFILMVWVGGKKGARSFVSLFLNFITIMIAIAIMMNPAADIIFITIIASTVISCITLFFINEINSKTVTAFLATVITVVILLFFIYAITKMTMIQGFGEEEIDEIKIFSLYIGMDFIKMSAAVIIMSTIGAITDVAISITSPMREIFLLHPTISREDLFKSGMTIGKDILGSNTNTLFFAFIGGYMGLLIWFKDLSYSIGQIANSKVFGAEMITIFSAGIGIALVVPISAAISALYLDRERMKNNM